MNTGGGCRVQQGRQLRCALPFALHTRALGLLGCFLLGDVQPDPGHITAPGGVAERKFGDEPAAAAAIGVFGFFVKLGGLIARQHRQIVTAKLGCNPGRPQLGIRLA